MYLLAKFQLHILKAFEVTAPQSSSIRKIDFTVSIRKINYRRLLKWINLQYEWSGAQTRDLHHRVCHHLRNGLLGNLFLILPCITTNKVEIYEETLIANNRSNVMWTNGHKLQFPRCTAFKWAPLTWANKMIPKF